ncbi:hypothetical protein BJV77DRAFT_979533, partial [Russula vinacea]
MTSRHQAASTSNENLVFGHGRHTCPGRLFAVNEMKAVIAHIVATMMSGLRKGKGFRARFASLNCVYLGERMFCLGLAEV